MLRFAPFLEGEELEPLLAELNLVFLHEEASSLALRSSRVWNKIIALMQIKKCSWSLRLFVFVLMTLPAAPSDGEAVAVFENAT